MGRKRSRAVFGRLSTNQDGNNRTFVDIYDGEMNLYNVADPTGGADGWATNKKYVKDNFIGNKGTQTLNKTRGILSNLILWRQ